MILAVAGGVILYLPSRKPWQWVTLVSVVVWALAMQYLLPVTDTHHLQSILIRYQNSPISHVIYSTCQENPGYGRILSQYETLLSQDFWLGTKPPGYFIFYTTLRDIANLAGRVDCQQNLMAFIMVLFPMIAALTVIPLMMLSKALELDFPLRLTGLILFSIPGVVFFGLIADQAVYPFLFTLTLWLTIECGRRRNLILPFFVGMLLYLDVFLTFSLLPLLGWAALWFGFSYIYASEETRRLLFEQSLAIAAGFITALLVLWCVGGYLPSQRYLNAFSSHRAIKPLTGGVVEFFTVIFLNNFEYIFWVGLPVCLLAGASLIDWLRKPLQDGPRQKYLIAVSLVVMFVLLNLAGQTRGEVGRLCFLRHPRWPCWRQMV